MQFHAIPHLLAGKREIPLKPDVPSLRGEIGVTGNNQCGQGALAERTIYAKEGFDSGCIGEIECAIEDIGDVLEGFGEICGEGAFDCTCRQGSCRRYNSAINQHIVPESLFSNSRLLNSSA